MKSFLLVLPGVSAAAGLALAAVLGLASPAAGAQAQAKPAAAPTLSIEVTDRGGDPLDEVSVAVTGPVDRSGTTGEKGTIVFRAMRAGTYRLRFEHDGFVTLERDVVMTAKPATISVALTAVPEPEAQPDPEPSPPPAPGPADAPVREVAPRMLSVPDFAERNLIRREPHLATLIACAEGGTARLLQIRDPLEHQLHDEVDEILYVIAGAGILHLDARDTKIDAGFFALIPRGVPHTLRRQGRHPLVALSVLTGTPCMEEP
jgi:mannose-6-phosphate isomerase-like protein (cupin superfamily)